MSGSHEIAEKMLRHYDPITEEHALAQAFLAEQRQRTAILHELDRRGNALAAQQPVIDALRQALQQIEIVNDTIPPSNQVLRQTVEAMRKTARAALAAAAPPEVKA